MRKQIVIDTDSYKITHWKQFPQDITKMYSYGESRVNSVYPEVCYFGGRMVIKDHFMQKVTQEMIEEGYERSVKTFGTDQYFDRETWTKVKELGFLPIRIRAVPEGSVVPIDNVLFTIESTMPFFAKKMQALESLLMYIWYPTTIATRSMHIKRSLKPIFDKTCENPNTHLLFAVNDFGMRGATGHEAAARGGSAHLIHFAGSDNEPGMTALHDYYGCEDRLKSVWATEHSVETSYGEGEGELEYIRAQLLGAPKDKIVSIVIDGYDSDNFVQNIVAHESVKPLIKERTANLMLRPDSGDPKTNVLKYLDMLGGIFGYHINSKGFKKLSAPIGIIQGDGMDEHSIPNLYGEITHAGWSAENLVTGSGGGLLQVDVNRDTQRFAIKACYSERNGIGYNMKKNPATDHSKRSKSGLLKLHQTTRIFMTLQSSSMTPAEFKGYTDCMETVFDNGELKDESFSNILERCE